MCWQGPEKVALAPLLPAAIPVLRMLQLPAVYGISNAVALGVESFLAGLEKALQGGLRFVQLREPGLAAVRFESLFEQVRERCRTHRARLLVSAAHPPDFWRACDGVHLRGIDLRGLRERPGAGIVGASCHYAGELARAADLGCDFAVLGPVQRTASHPGAAPLGWTAFEALVRGAQLPVFGLGGLSPGDALQARRAGAHGLAMMRAVWPAPSSSMS